MSTARRFAVGLAVILGFAATNAFAQPSPEDKAVAESLFRDGRRMMDEGKFKEACRKLEESQRLDPADGTLLNLAVCHEKEGRVATAWGEFMTALTSARREGRSDRESLAREHIQAIEPTLPRLFIEVPQTARVPGLKVLRNGTPLQQGAWDTAIPIDPGEVEIEAQAPDYKPWKTKLTIALAKTDRVTVPKLLPAPPAPKASATGFVGLQTPPPDSGGQRITGLVLGGVGLAAVGVGSYFGIRASSKRSDSDDGCKVVNGQEQCTQRAVDLNEEARTSARIADVSIGLGVVALAAGAYLYFTSPAGSSTSAASNGSRNHKASRGLPVNVSFGPTGNNGAAASIQGVW